MPTETSDTLNHHRATTVYARTTGLLLPRTSYECRPTNSRAIVLRNTRQPEQRNQSSVFGILHKVCKVLWIIEGGYANFDKKDKTETHIQF